MKTKTLFRFVLLLCVHSMGQAQSYAAEEQAVPWLRIYSEYVHDIYFDLSNPQIAQGFQAKHVLVALSRKNIYPAEYAKSQIKLMNYATNQVENELGCIVHPNDYSSAIDACGRLRLKALRKFPSENQACKSAEKPFFQPLLFVDKKLRHVRCVGKSYAADRYVYYAESNEWFRQHIDLTARHPIRSDIPSELVMGQNAYLGLESNRLFGCFGYGVPVTYRERKVPPEEALKTRPEYDDSFYRMPPTWQYQYLIKTKGFLYYCEQGKRLIDEVEEYGITLADGTALLRGNVSVLRIRTRDGSTDALVDRIKRVAPALTRQRLVDAIGAKALKANPDVCNPSISSECPLDILGGWMPGMKVQTSHHFIQGIDHVMQSFFTKP